MFEFQNPWSLLILPIVLLMAIIHFRYRKSFGILLVKSERFHQVETSLLLKVKRKMIPYIEFFLYASLVPLVVALSGPQTKFFWRDRTQFGLDIMIALDISGSMVNSYDFLPNNRLSVSKSLLQKFTAKRKNDRIGLVVFAGAAYLQAPLTNDIEILSELIASASEGDIEEQGTAIGDALALASYRLKDTEAVSKIIILLTDGVSNTGKLDPETASSVAENLGIRVYCIGIGREQSQYEVNYESLEKIASYTKGKFYRAESPEILSNVFDEINSLEVSELPQRPETIEQSHFTKFVFYYFVFMGFCAFLYGFLFPEKL